MILDGLNAWNLWNEHWEHCPYLSPLRSAPSIATRTSAPRTSPGAMETRLSCTYLMPIYFCPRNIPHTLDLLLLVTTTPRKWLERLPTTTRRTNRLMIRILSGIPELV